MKLGYKSTTILITLFVLLQVAVLAQVEKPVSAQLKGHESAVVSIAFAPNSREAISGSTDGTAVLWEVETGSITHTFSALGGNVLSVAFSPNGRTICFGTSSGKTVLYDAIDYKEITSLVGSAGAINSVSFSGNGKLIASAGDDKVIRIWEIASFKLVRTLRGINSNIISIHISSDNESLISLSSDKKVRVWNLETGRLLRTIEIPYSASSLSVSPDSKNFSIAFSDNVVRQYSVSTGKELRTLKGHTASVNSVSYFNDGGYLAAGSADKTIKIWEANTGKFTGTLKGMDAEITTLAISPDGSRVLGAGGTDLLVWNINLPAISGGYNRFEAGAPASTLPPLLSIQDITFSTTYLNAGETAQLTITVKNNGPGDAQEVYAELSSNQPLLSFPKSVIFPMIPKNGGVQSINIFVFGEVDLPSSSAFIDIKVVDPNFKIVLQGRRIDFDIKEFPKPNLQLARYAVTEQQSGNPNNQIDINEIVELNVAIQNIGEGSAADVTLAVTNTQQGVMFLGAYEGGKLISGNPRINRLEGGKFSIASFRYFINSEFTDSIISFNVSGDEKYGKYGFTQDISVDVNTELKPEGFVLQIKKENGSSKGVTIEDVPEFVSDVRSDIPVTPEKNTSAVAVVIGNRDYKVSPSKQTQFSVDDAALMKQYLVNTLGYEESNVILIQNATLSDMISVFGTKENNRGILYNSIKESNSDIFVYFSGQGVTDGSNDEQYLLPIDGDISKPSVNGYKVNTLMENLSKLQYKSLTVVTDASFEYNDKSTRKNQGNSTESPIFDIRNTTIIGAVSGQQTASAFPENQNSLFTYYLLKALRGEADSNRDRKLTLGEMKSYLSETIPVVSRNLYNREQSPVIFGDENRVIVNY